MPTDQLLAQQLAFLNEIDRLKSVLRQSPLLDRSRRENSAEHSWHLALYALILREQAAPEVNIGRVLRMLLLHDLVEIDVGDTPFHGGASAAQQAEDEDRAAVRIFGLLPAPQGPELLALWREFEAAESTDACFAKALDRVQPLMANLHTEGGTWVESGVSLEQVLEKYGTPIRRASPALWAACEVRVRAHFAGRAMDEAGAGPGSAAGHPPVADP
jgi:putative hydrolases of HD superfamily